MYEMDEKRFSESLWQLMGRVLTAQDCDKFAHSTKISFHSGWFEEEEGYKRVLWDKAQDILQYRMWNENHIWDYHITDRIKDCMDIPMESGKKNNLLDWRDDENFKKSMNKETEFSEILFYQIFCDPDEKKAFNDAIDAWGHTYPFITFLFYLKDKNRFLPVRPDTMKRRFEKLGIQTDCLNFCTWEHYQEYLQIMKGVQDVLRRDIDPDTELIDAHSFVWAMWFLNDTRTDPLPAQIEKIDQDVFDKQLQGDDRKAFVKVRVNQTELRKRMFIRYHKCHLCGVSSPELLNVSHIKPWSRSNRSEKVDTDNAFLLCPNHDRLFDEGWISFSDDGSIIISSQLSQADRIFMNVHDGMTIELTDGNKEYLKYHRENIFRQV